MEFMDLKYSGIFHITSEFMDLKYSGIHITSEFMEFRVRKVNFE